MIIHRLIADLPLGNFQPVTESFSKGSTDANGLGAAKNLELFVSNAIGIITILAGLSFVLYFVLGALNWTTAGGEQAKVTKARDQMVQSVIGMVVVVISYALIGVVGTFLGFDFLNPGCGFLKLVPGLNPSC